MKKLAFIAMAGILIGNYVFAAADSSRCALIQIAAPKSAQVTTFVPTASSDLTFKALPTPNIVFRAWYSVKTNQAQAGSGTVTITGKTRTCKFNLFYLNGWQAVNMGAEDPNCYAFVSNNLIGLTLKK